MYILVTPAKNEERNLPLTIKSIESQTLKPVLWVIVDDGSTDNTPQIIDEAKKKHNWIQSIQLDGGIRDTGIHYASLLNAGVDYANEYCRKNNKAFGYIGTVDADMYLDEFYFECIIKEFIKDPKLGIASGGTWIRFKGQEIQLSLREDIPSGGHRLWKKQCFEDIGGIPLSYAVDSVTNTKAKLKGWKVKRFENYKAVQARATFSAEGLWKGWKDQGEAMYYLGVPPFYAIIRALSYLLKRPYYIGIAYLVGYFCCLTARKKKINDEEIKYYNRYVRPKEVRDFYLRKFLKFINNRK